MSRQGVDKVAAKNVSYELLKGYKGDMSDIKNSSIGKYFEPTEADKKKLEDIAAYNNSDDKAKKRLLEIEGKTEAEFLNMESLEKAGEQMQLDDLEDKLNQAYANAIVATVSTAMESINSAVIEEAKTKLEGLQYEEKILNERKAGYSGWT